MNLVKYIIIIFLIVILLLQMKLALFSNDSSQNTPIKVGVVFSTSGPRSVHEYPIQQAVLMAIEEVNQTGGINRRKIEPILRDTQSDEALSFQAINELKNQKVAAIFGGWIASQENEISHLLKENNILLFSPYQYENISNPENIIHLGISAYQQAAPAVNFSFENFGKNFILIGSDLIYSKITNSIIRELVEAKKGTILEEHYITSNNFNIRQIAQQIAFSKPSVIISTLKGSDSLYFFKELKRLTENGSKIPVISFYINEIDLKSVENIDDYVGHYAVWNYFQNIDTEVNKKFVDDFSAFSKLEVTNNEIEAGYNSVNLWNKGLKESKNVEAKPLLKVFRSLQLLAPEGPIALTLNGLYAWKYSRIGKITKDRTFEIIWTSEEALRPIPYHISEIQKSSFADSLLFKNRREI